MQYAQVEKKVNNKTVTNIMSCFFKAILKYKFLYALMLPGIVWYIMYRYLPMFGLIIAFKEYNFALGIWDSPWVGMKYFNYLFSSSEFYTVLQNTVVINMYNLIFGFPAPIILALLLNEFKNMFFKRTIQTVIYFPHFLSWVVFGGIIIQFLSPNEGFVNQIIKYFGGDPIFFLTQSQYFRSILVVTNILKEAGWGTIIYLAALAGVEQEQYEAATVDGANRWQKLIHITLPGITNVIIIMLILKVGYLLDVGFEQIFIMYNPAVYDVSDVLSTYIYRVGIQDLRFSLTTALGLFQAVIGFILIYGVNSIAKKYSDVSMW
ncbi:ABC transporter permease subunit [Paenibacillus sp. WQ 127069]|uniref:ABC transporter permease subunit n=1 Tax=Paenibacillus baimaensis TaxID=2982185 RepID=A0ABT2UC73_9BACL|nr:ABC transporter permease subunit [Paenibacillus sp. WQ 127069]MCU6792229.1 ABC transporter permease subunit [Paenibacillus sp. WQ 127069]